MMASTLADNSSTRPCASGRKGEQKIAPFASRRRYDCKRLHIADPVYPPIVINDGTAPSRWNHLIDRNILQWHEAASAIHLAPAPAEGRQDRPPHRVVRPELKYGKQAWQHAPVMIGPGTTHHLVDAPVQSALRMALLDDRRQLGLTGDRENDIADAPRWFIDRGAGDLDQQALLSIDPLDVFRDIAHHLAFRARSDLVNGFDQQVDHRVSELRLPRH